MTEKEATERERKKSVRCYAQRVLKESSVSAVSGIVSTESLPRKAFKLIIFLILTSAFLYQVIKFLTYLYEYPTVVNIDLSTPESYMAPAFTMCNSQIIRRSKYCAKYPDRCIPTDEEFCEEYSRYCRTANIRVKKEFYWESINHDDVLNMGYGLEDTLLNFELDENDGTFSNTSLLLLRFINDSELDGYSLCLTFNSIVKKSDYPIIFKKSDFIESEIQRKVLSLKLDPHEEDAFDPDIMPGIYFSVHSPYDAVNPFQTGHYMLPGRRYKFSIRLKEEQLLPYPYPTDCMDYIQIWEENGRTGPRSKGMCKQKCIVDFMSHCRNCSALLFSYPSGNENICSREDYEDWEDDLTEECLVQYNSVDDCITACKDECFRPIYVDVDVDDDEILRYVFSPKYQQVEAFSYIGGFIGIWLGISLVQVTDFFVSLFLIGRYLFKRCTCSSEPQSI